MDLAKISVGGPQVASRAYLSVLTLTATAIGQAAVEDSRESQMDQVKFAAVYLLDLV